MRHGVRKTCGATPWRPRPCARAGSALPAGTRLCLTLHYLHTLTACEVRLLGGRLVGMRQRLQRGRARHGQQWRRARERDGRHFDLGTGVLLDNASGAGSSRETFITHATMDSDNVSLLVNDSFYVSVAGCWAASSDQAQVLLAEGAAGAHVAIAGAAILSVCQGHPPPCLCAPACGRARGRWQDAWRWR